MHPNALKRGELDFIVSWVFFNQNHQHQSEGMWKNFVLFKVKKNEKL